MTGNWTVIEAAPVASLRCGGRISLPRRPDISFRLIAACFLSWADSSILFFKHFKNVSMNSGPIYQTEWAWLWGSKDDQNMAECSAAPLLSSPSLHCLLPDLRLCIINIGGKGVGNRKLETYFHFPPGSISLGYPALRRYENGTPTQRSWETCRFVSIESYSRPYHIAYSNCGGVSILCLLVGSM